jgi:hypothetical protein
MDPDDCCDEKNSGSTLLLTAVTATREKRAPDRALLSMHGIPHGQTGVAPNAIELHPVLKCLAVSCSHCRQARA